MSAFPVVCCEWLRDMLSRAGEKGFAVIALKDGEHRAFYIQARPFEPDVVEKYNKVDEDTGFVKWPAMNDMSGVPVPYVVSMDLRIHYCPSCGTDLNRWVKRHTTEFDKLAEMASKLPS